MDKILTKKKNRKMQGFLCFSKMKMVDFVTVLTKMINILSYNNQLQQKRARV